VLLHRLGLDFTVTIEHFGIKRQIELVPGGRKKAVTDDNKEEYLRLRLRYRYSSCCYCMHYSVETLRLGVAITVVSVALNCVQMLYVLAKCVCV
jgi:HECT-domain (ubiquitin-transferase)